MPPFAFTRLIWFEHCLNLYKTDDRERHVTLSIRNLHARFLETIMRLSLDGSHDLEQLFQNTDSNKKRELQFV